MSELKTKAWWPTKEQQLEYCRNQRDAALYYMEGEDAEGFAKWEGLFCAWDTIVKAMEKEAHEYDRNE